MTKPKSSKLKKMTDRINKGLRLYSFNKFELGKMLIEAREQGKKISDKEIEEIKQFCFNDGVDTGRKQTLEEVQKKFINCVEHSDFEDWLEKELSKDGN